MGCGTLTTPLAAGARLHHSRLTRVRRSTSSEPGPGYRAGTDGVVSPAGVGARAGNRTARNPGSGIGLPAAASIELTEDMDESPQIRHRRRCSDRLRSRRPRPRQGRREDVYPRLRAGTHRRHVALDARQECQCPHGHRRQLLPDQARPGLFPVGHRHRRCHRRDAERPARRRRPGSAGAGRSRWRRSCRNSASSPTTSSSWRFPTPIPTMPAMPSCSPSRCCWSRRPNTIGRTPRAAALQAGAPRHQARRRPRRVRRRQRHHHLDARPYAGASVAARQAAQDRPGAADRRRRALQGELGRQGGAGRQLRQGEDGHLDGAHGRRARPEQGRHLDQPRQGPARGAEAVAAGGAVLRV